MPRPRQRSAQESFDEWWKRAIGVIRDLVSLVVGVYLLTRPDPSLWQLAFGALCAGVIASSVFLQVFGRAFGVNGGKQ